jgi:hypothetical protein
MYHFKEIEHVTKGILQLTLVLLDVEEFDG